MKRSDRKILTILAILLLLALAIVVWNRRDRPVKITRQETADELQVNLYCYDKSNQPFKAFFSEERLLLQSQKLKGEFVSDEKVVQARIIITDLDGRQVKYRPIEGITKQMQTEGTYSLCWKLPKIPQEGTLLLSLKLESGRRKFETEYTTGIPDLADFFIGQSQVFNTELKMENLQMGTEGESINYKGLCYQERIGNTYTSIKDMDKAVESLFSKRYIEEYHSFFEDYYLFENGKMYQQNVKGIQKVALLRPANVKEITYEETEPDYCVLYCTMQKGGYRLIFVKEESGEWRLDSFSYDK